MGYTHYFTFVAPKRGSAAKTEKAYQAAVLVCQKIVKTYADEHGGISGFAAHTMPGTYGGLCVNGSQNSGMCEDFVLREHFKQNEQGNFCKTNRLPYDTVVTACLCVLALYLDKNIIVNSDGNSHDWIGGLELARRVTGLKRLQLPVGIRRAKLKAV